MFVLTGAQFVPTFSLYVAALFVLTGVPVGVRVLPLRLRRLLPTSSLYVAALFVLTGAPVYTNIFTLCSSVVRVDRCP